MNQNDRSKSPFSELSFSQQQEQWRIFRAQQAGFSGCRKQKGAAARPAAPGRALRARFASAAAAQP